MVKLAAFLLIFMFFASANAQVPPYGQTIGSLPQLLSLNGADFAPIVQNGKDYKAPISQIASFLGSPQGNNHDVQYNNAGVFGGSDQFAFDTYAVGIGTPSPRPQTSLDIGFRTDSIILPSGTSAQRPTSTVNGMIRFNTDNQSVEAFYNGVWNSLGVSTPTGNFLITESGNVITTESGDGITVN